MSESASMRIFQAMVFQFQINAAQVPKIFIIFQSQILLNTQINFKFKNGNKQFKAF